MEQAELKRNLEFEYWGYYAAERSDAEWNHLPFKPMTLAEFTQSRQAMVDDTLNRLPRLKPCPFCGGEPYLTSEPNFDGRMWHSIQCKCGTSGPVFIDHKHLAVQGWNKMCGQNVTLMSITRTDEEES